MVRIVRRPGYDGTSAGVVVCQEALLRFDRSVRTGVRVIAANVSGDGIADLIATARAQCGPKVKVFDGRRPNCCSPFEELSHFQLIPEGE